MRRTRCIGVVLAALSGMSSAGRAGTAVERSAGGWALTGPIHDAREAQAATLLADGRVLVCGGIDPRSTTIKLIASCELWSPETERWIPAGSLPYPRAFSASVRLADGRVAIVGGTDGGIPGAAPEASRAIDIWDPQHNDAQTAALLPFAAERPHVVLLPNDELLIVDDGPHDAGPRGAVWNPANGKMRAESLPAGVGRTVALLADAQGTLTLVRSAADCGHVSIWRRRSGQVWSEVHVDRILGCAAGAFFLDERQLVFWSRKDAETGLSSTIVWDSSSGESHQMSTPDAAQQTFIVPLTGGELLSIGSRRSHHLGRRTGWLPSGALADVELGGTFTLLLDGRVLMLGPLLSRVWTPSDYSGRPCVFITALLEDAANRKGASLEGLSRESLGPACARAIAADPALAPSRALRAVAELPGADVAKAALHLVCELRPRWAVDLMIRGIAPGGSGDAAGCLVGLAESDQAAARQAVDGYVQDCVRGDRDLAVLASAAGRSEAVRQRSGVVLVAAWDRRRAGFDSLRRITCREPVPKAAAPICAKSEGAQEESRDARTRRRQWMETGVVTTLGVGLAVAGSLNRNNDAGRAIAIASGTLGASALFTASVWSNQESGPNPLAPYFAAISIGVSGALGLVGSVLATQSPGASRAVVSIAGGTLLTTIHLAAIWLF